MTIQIWWQQRNLREQQLLKIGGFLLAIFLGYFMLWAPLDETIDQKKAVRETAQTTLVFMQQADARLQTLKPVNGQPMRSPLVSVQTALQTLSISDHPTTLTQTDPNQVQLQFETIGFDALITLLSQVWEKDRLMVQNLQVTKTNTPGVVQATITLKTLGFAQTYTS